MHGPLTTTSPALSALVSTYDGVAGMPSQSDLDAFPPPSLVKWKLVYYRDVILVDERRFLVSEALEHIHSCSADGGRGDEEGGHSGGEMLDRCSGNGMGGVEIV